MGHDGKGNLVCHIFWEVYLFVDLFVYLVFCVFIYSFIYLCIYLSSYYSTPYKFFPPVVFSFSKPPGIFEYSRQS